MKTKEQREAEFRKELVSLLKKYEADIDIVMEGRDYMQTPHIEVSMWAVFDHEGALTEEYAEFKL